MLLAGCSLLLVMLDVECDPNCVELRDDLAPYIPEQYCTDRVIPTCHRKMNSEFLSKVDS